MKYSEQIKPISFLKANAPEVIRDLAEKGGAVIITQRGHATAVLQDIVTYEQTQETLALLKMLAMSEKSAAEGKGEPVKKAFADIRRQIGRRRSKT